MAATIYEPLSTAHLKLCTVDFDRRHDKKAVNLVQYDQTIPVLCVSLKKGGTEYKVPSDADVNIRMDKRDGHHVYNHALGVNAERTVAYFAVTPQISTGWGDYYPIVEITVGGGIAGSAPIWLHFDRNPLPENAIISSDEYKTLEQLVADVNASAQAAANSAAAAKTSEDAAANSAADADRTAKDIKDSMAQISENKEAVSQLKEDLSGFSEMVFDEVKKTVKDSATAWKTNYYDMFVPRNALVSFTNNLTTPTTLSVKYSDDTTKTIKEPVAAGETIEFFAEHTIVQFASYLNGPNAFDFTVVIKSRIMDSVNDVYGGFDGVYAVTSDKLVNRDAYLSGSTSPSDTVLSLYTHIIIPKGSAIVMIPNGQRLSYRLWSKSGGLSVENCLHEEGLTNEKTVFVREDSYFNIVIRKISESETIASDELAADIKVYPSIRESLSQTQKVVTEVDARVTEKDASLIETIKEATFNSNYYEGNNIFTTKLTTYEGVCAESGVMEPFLFFTDIHAFSGKTGWEKSLIDKMNAIQKIYNSSSANFIMSGGDWTSYTRDFNSASTELSMIHGIMKKMFINGYTVVGNHDEYHATDTEHDSSWFTEQQKSNTMFGGGSTYYSFDGVNSKCYAFDSGNDDADKPDEMTDYRWRQVDWFGNQLIRDDAEHSLVFMHIWTKSTVDPMNNVAPLARNITDMASAYNSHSSITLNGVEYDFTSCTGKMYAIIAGHIHQDFNGVDNGINVITTRTASHIGEGGFPSFDMFAIDYTKNVANAIRFGVGSDRTIALV